MTTRTALLGCGAMNEAILAGMLAAGRAPADVIVTVQRPERAAELAAKYPGITAAATQENPECNSQAIKGASVVILGIKPAGIAALAREISGSIAAETVVVSVAAAVTLTQLEEALPNSQPVIRALPNTPVRLGRGVVSLSPGTHCRLEQLEKAKAVFAGAGTVLEVPAKHVNAVSAISGSGPAYAYYLADAMAAAGTELGLSAELSALLARETVTGAGLVLAEPGADASALRKEMAGPNTITSRAVEVLMNEALPTLSRKAPAQQWTGRLRLPKSWPRRSICNRSGQTPLRALDCDDICPFCWDPETD